MKKNWLIISHAFNMDGRAASLTVTDKIPYLLSFGILPTVISSITGSKDSRFEHYQLLPWGPSGLRFDFRHWFAIRFGRGVFYKVITILFSFALLPFVLLERVILGLSSQSSWSLPTAFKGIQLVKQGKVDFIYSAGSAWSAHYSAWIIKKITGVTWLAEIHDPMVMRNDESDLGFSPRANRDLRFLQKLEGLICADADFICQFTDGALNYMYERHPEAKSKGFLIFPGSEPPGCHEPLPESHLYTDHLNFCHFGSLAKNRSLVPLLEVLNDFFKANPDARDIIRLQVYGTPLDDSSRSSVDALNLHDVVVINGRVEGDPVTGKSGRERIMGLMRSADVLLGLHGDFEWCAEYFPSKFYDYYWTNRPIFAITNRNAQLDSILTERCAYLSHTYEKSSIYKSVEMVFDDWKAKNLRLMPFRPISPKDAVERIIDRCDILN